MTPAGPVVAEHVTAPGGLGQSLARDELLSQYRAYRTRQARRLIQMLPREAVRPLYRRAIREGFGDESGSDPLGALVRYCESLLPLPPFAEW
ncbi:MAG TPA: hypothetical protein VFQ22_00965, partial [Longimicrobiales bacterium]|nr:hypothetical protein [Longimicrobiales bacterium]